MEHGRDLPYEDWKLLLEQSRHQVVAAGDRIFREGDEADSLYVILEGEVEVHRDVNGEHVHIVKRGANEVIGEMGLFVKGNRRTASATALSQGILLSVPGDPVRALRDIGHVESAIKLFKNLVTILAEKLRGHPDVTQ